MEDLVEFMTVEERKRLRRRQQFRDNAGLVRRLAVEKGVSVRSVSRALGYHPNALWAMMAPSAMKNGKMNLTAIERAVTYLQDLQCTPSEDT